MAKVHVITDTDANLPLDLAKKQNIVQVPITIQFGEESFEDLFQIDNKELFTRIDRSGKLPTTAAPSPAAFAKAFKQAFENGADSIICVTVGSKISRTHESALVAAAEMPEKKITLIDSGHLSLAQGFIAIAAAEALAAGKSHEEAVKVAESLTSRTYLFGSLSTLKYLALGGRVSTIAASMANLLNIRPILTMQNNKLELLEKVRTHRVAMKRLVELLENAVGDRPIERAAILHVNNLADANHLEAELRKKLALPADLLLVDFGPGLSVHAGAGMVGAVLVAKE